MCTRSRLTILLAGCLLIASVDPTTAQDPPPSDTEQPVQEDKKPAGAKPPLKVFGVIQADFYAGDAGGSDGEDSSFFIRRARLGARGVLTDRIGYRVMVALDGTNSDTLASDVRTFDAYVDVSLTDSLQLRAGQYKYTFDREGRRSAAALPLITRSRVANALAGRLGQAGGAFRDVGVELNGSASQWSYTLGVVNGNGINKRDNNNDKDVYLRASVEPFSGLNLGAGLFEGTSVITGAESDEQIVTIDAMYERGPLAVMGAFYSASYSRREAVDVEPEGFYLVSTYRVRPRVELALRYQDFDQDSNSPGRSFDSVDFGATYYFEPRGRWGGLKASFNYLARSAEAAATSSVWEERGAGIVGDANDVFLARLQVLF
ncbi:MAG: OprO/OprP family phosphate-selective porin [Acidobacteriota bacterium]|nr:OprO/OprP family phosphate-selective porin [Acidobacteriota bacterium]